MVKVMTLSSNLLFVCAFLNISYCLSFKVPAMEKAFQIMERWMSGQYQEKCTVMLITQSELAFGEKRGYDDFSVC